MPREVKMELEAKKFELARDYPLVCLNTIFNAKRIKQLGLRPHEEITNNVSQAIGILKMNPMEVYEEDFYKS